MIGIRGFARARRVLLFVVLVFAVLPAGSALADTTIGQVGSGSSGVIVTCGGRLVLVDPGYVVPSGGGTITSFSFESTSFNAGQQLDFLALRPVSGGYSVVGKTGVVTLAGTGLESFPASVPVQADDVLGFWTSGSLTNCARFGTGTIEAGVSSTDPSVGQTILTPAPISPFDLNESANLMTLPTSKDQCKKGGWKDFGSQFKNQGDCVSFVATGGKNQPSGS